MKKALLIMIISGCSKCMHAQQADTLTSDSPAASAIISDRTFDFGAVTANTSVTKQIQFQNYGSTTLVISDVQVAARPSKDPECYISATAGRKSIKPGKKAAIFITCKALDDAGSFTQTVLLTLRGSSAPIQFHIKGTIIPQRSEQAAGYEPLTPLGAVLGAIIINNMGK